MPRIHDPMVGPGGERPIVARWVVTGDIVLTSAAHLCNGEGGERVDMPLLQDRLEGKPLLLGSSLAGGLRSYILDRLDGYTTGEEPIAKDRRNTEDAARAYRAKELQIVSDLFGGARRDDEGGQSPLIVFDSLGIPPKNAASEIRDGVAIDSAQGLAEDHKKFDFEVLPAGTRFPLRFELVIVNEKNGDIVDHNFAPVNESALVSLLASVLEGFEHQDIPIGARRSRGLGACHVTSWRAVRFDLQTKKGWLTWLGSEHEQPIPGSVPTKQSIHQALTAAWPELTLTDQADERKRVLIKVQLALQGGLLVRSPGTDPSAADATHLVSGGHPVLPGTGLAGALRGRALRIARSVHGDKQTAEKWVDQIFGPRSVRTTGAVPLAASRLRVSETPLQKGKFLRPSRIKVDRFTGGVIDGALFDEEPLYGGEVEVTLELRNPQLGETGLVLLLLKDLMTGDLPVGGTSSVGRGILRGTATVTLNKQVYTIDPDNPADSETVQALNETVQEFHNAKPLGNMALKEEAA